MILTLTCKSKNLGMRITSKGQVTIPADIREQAGLLPHTDVEFNFDGTDLRIVRTTVSKADDRGARVVAHLKAHPGDIPMSTEETWR